MSWRRLALDSHAVGGSARWGLMRAPRENLRAARAERRWRWPLLLALIATIPAFYVDLLPQTPSSVAVAIYLVAAVTLCVALSHVAMLSPAPLTHLRANATDLALIAGLLVAATPASRIFAVFVVLLGYGVLSLVTAAIAARWVETEERRIEREILRDMRREMAALRQDIIGLRQALPAPPTVSERQPVRLDMEQAVEDQ
jgi:hypothetical protein